MKRALISMMTVAIFAVVSGCAGPQRTTITRAKLGYKTYSHQMLVSLPKPKGKIVTAVYNFRDQTGQYKYHPTSSNFSTAVTQGATSMLVQALKESGWFIPVEREGFNNLLTERKIIRAGLNGDESSLPKLLPAPMIMEGGIISYETNVSTGGLGAKYFGVGGSALYQKDQVAIYLRAVDVNRGEIIESVSTTKSILSQEVDFGVFRFVDYKRLLEAEIGYSKNEPVQLCVLDAIEKALVSLIVEGILNNRWEPADPAALNTPAVISYLEEKGVADPLATIQAYIDRKDQSPGALPQN